MNYAFLPVLVVGLLWAVVGVIYSRVARGRAEFLGFMLFSSTLSALGAWLLLPRYAALAGPALAGAFRPAPLLLLGGAASSLGMAAMNRGMQRGHHGATWSLSQSALVVPFLCGVAVWGDRVAPWNWGGLLAVLGGILLLGLGRNHGAADPAAGGRGWLAASLLALALLGVQQTLVGVPSRWPDWQDSARLRVPLMMTGSMLGYAALALPRRRRPAFGQWRGALALTTVGLASQALMFRSLDLFAADSRAALVFPIAVGTCVAGFSGYSLLVLKEQAGPLRLWGMALGCLGVVLVALK